jgi:hypothetical protein
VVGESAGPEFGGFDYFHFTLQSAN